MEINLDMSNATEPYGSTREGFLYSTITLNIFMILIQVPWIIYLMNHIFQIDKIVSRLVLNGFQHEDLNLVFRKRNKLLLHKYLLMNLVFELLVLVLIVINTTIRCMPIREIGQSDVDTIDWLPYTYLYVKYVAGLIEMVFVQCVLDTLNLTTLFVKDVYLRNSTHSGMKKRINRFIMRFLLVLALGVSGIGLGIAYILCEVFLITQLVQYYRYSRQLYRSLGMHYEDTKYEFGGTSIEARTAWKHKKHYKWSAIWYFTIAIGFVLSTTIFELYLPLNFIGEKSIKRRLTNETIAFTNSEIYHYTNIVYSVLSSGVYIFVWLTYLPIYVIFSMYYLCDRFLFAKVYRHRFHVNDRYEVEPLIK